MKLKLFFSVLLFLDLIILSSCAESGDKKENSGIQKEKFGEVDGREISIFTLTNSNGVKVKIINYGAIVQSLVVPDRNGKPGDVVTGFNTLEDYVNNRSYFGATVGRYGNRIRNAKVTIEGKEYQLTKNDGPNHLHGGTKGFFKAVWDAEPMQTDEGQAVKLTYTSPDGEEGYPGTVTISLTYTLTEDNGLKLVYEGKTDKATILNPTHHSYFNLSADFKNDILSHELYIDADSITPVDPTLIPTGELMAVENTPMDFRTPAPIGSRIDVGTDQLKYGRGYDHNWVLNNYSKGKTRKAASLYDPQTGRLMELITDQPGLQFYSGNFLDGNTTGKDSVSYQFRTSLCLEPQHFPDTPNKPGFPPVILKPGEVYRQTTIYKFSTK